MAMEKTNNARPMKRHHKKVCMFCADRAETIDYKDCLLYTSDAADEL